MSLRIVRACAIFATGWAGSAAAALPQEPELVTAATLADRAALDRLQRPGTLLFADGFETEESLAKYFEIRGLADGRAKLLFDGDAHAGRGCFEFHAPDSGGRSSGSGASLWLGAEGHERLYFRRYIRFAPDYDQGNLNHVGGGLTGVAGDDKWAGMGTAGLKPVGDDHFSSSFEPWREWGRRPPPGTMFLYTYWMDMKRDKDGHYWGNMLEPEPADRLELERDRWTCLEHMIAVNDPGEANGELAAWIDGELYLHFTGIRWRSAPDVLLKRAGFGIYVHEARRDNVVWYDDVALSTGYIGPIGEGD